MQAQDHSSFVSLTVKFWNKKTFYRSPIIDSFKIILTRVAQKNLFPGKIISAVMRNSQLLTETDS